MIRIASRPTPATAAWHKGFLRMLPAIATHARISFQHLGPEAREEAIAECVANALVAYVRLVELGKVDLAYPSPLARYAVAQTKGHRRVGGHLNIKDVLSPYCQAKKHVTVERLDCFDDEEDAWQEAVIEDTRTATVPDIVAFRCDFPAWLHTLSRRDRKIAEALSVGHRTGDVAKWFRLSAGRVSQLRGELGRSWRAFVGEGPDDAADAAPAPA